MNLGINHSHGTDFLHVSLVNYLWAFEDCDIERAERMARTHLIFGMFLKFYFFFGVLTQEDGQDEDKDE